MAGVPEGERSPPRAKRNRERGDVQAELGSHLDVLRAHRERGGDRAFVRKRHAAGLYLPAVKLAAALRVRRGGERNGIARGSLGRSCRCLACVAALLGDGHRELLRLRLRRLRASRQNRDERRRPSPSSFPCPMPSQYGIFCLSGSAKQLIAAC